MEPVQTIPSGLVPSPPWRRNNQEQNPTVLATQEIPYVSIKKDDSGKQFELSALCLNLTFVFITVTWSLIKNSNILEITLSELSYYCYFSYNWLQHGTISRKNVKVLVSIEKIKNFMSWYLGKEQLVNTQLERLPSRKGSKTKSVFCVINVISFRQLHLQSLCFPQSLKAKEKTQHNCFLKFKREDFLHAVSFSYFDVAFVLNGNQVYKASYRSLLKIT